VKTSRKSAVCRTINNSYQSCGLNKTDNLKKTLAKVSALEPKSNYSQESNYGIEKPGFKSAAYLTGHQIGSSIINNNIIAIRKFNNISIFIQLFRHFHNIKY
jgi:hypothetical protein